MKKINYNLKSIPNEALYRKLAGKSGIFLDIETTGLKRESNHVYLIGVMYPFPLHVDAVDASASEEEYESGFCMSFFFSDNNDEEAETLASFSEFLKEFKRNMSGISDSAESASLKFITFNGDRFDLPFLRERYRFHGLDCPPALSGENSIDIYKLIKPYRKYFGLSHMDQRSIESMLHIQRDDPFSGKELIDKYHEYALSRSREIFDILLTHNREDVSRMAEILPVLSYTEVFSASKAQASPDNNNDISDDTEIIDNNGFNIINYKKNEHPGFDGELLKELVIEFELPSRVPFPHLFHADRIFLEMKEGEGKLKVPVFCGELKHYFNNYRDYLYIPSEDRAILKTLGNLMDKSLTTRASKENCYIRHSGEFLPLPEGSCLQNLPLYSQGVKTAPYVRLEEIKDTPVIREYLIKAIYGFFK